MCNSWLTVDLVEDIQLALQQNKPLGPTIQSLKRTTLPAIMQYRCLQEFTNGTLPELPQLILSTPIGKALLQIEAHLRAQSSPTPPRIKNVDCRSVEFSSVTAAQDLETEAWGLFQARFNRSVQSVGFARPTADLLQGALYEMSENAILHSKAKSPIIVGYCILPDSVQFSVADSGIGVLASLRSHPDYASLDTHTEALRKALQDGVSRFGSRRGGLGFRQVFKAIAAEWGLLRFRSGEACILIDGNECDADKGTESFVQNLPGFQVTVSCRNSSMPLNQWLI